MKLQGEFTVALFDGTEQYHANGSWIIKRGDQIIAASVDRAEWSAETFDVRARLSAVRAGDKLSATSSTRKTGVVGEIIARAGNWLAIDGEAWGPSHSSWGPSHSSAPRGAVAIGTGRCRLDRALLESHSSLAPRGAVRLRTYTFRVVSRRDCFYSGTLEFCLGMRADHELVQRIESLEALQEIQ